MSSRDSFWFLAGALITIAALAALRVSFREPRAALERSGIPSIAVLVAAALTLVGVAVGVYFLLGSPTSIASDRNPSARGMRTRQPQVATLTNAGSLEDVTAKLAARLAANGGSDAEWRLLAQSYEYMGRTAEAQAAAAHTVAAASTEMTDSHVGTANGPVSAGQLAAAAAVLDSAGPATGHDLSAASAVRHGAIAATVTNGASGNAQGSATGSIDSARQESH